MEYRGGIRRNELPAEDAKELAELEKLMNAVPNTPPLRAMSDAAPGDDLADEVSQ